MAAVWESFTREEQWRDYLQKLVKTNDRALRRAVCLIYDYQTPEEKQERKSIEENSVGFSRIDAIELGAVAEKLKKGEEPSEGEMAKARNKMPKYWRQLMWISKEQQKAKKEKQDVEEQAKRDWYEAEQFKGHIRELKLCAGKGIACGYGICDECPVTTGLQMCFSMPEIDDANTAHISAQERGIDSPQANMRVSSEEAQEAPGIALEQQITAGRPQAGQERSQE